MNSFDTSLKQLNDSDCIYSCVGNSQEKCGGNYLYTLSIYGTNQSKFDIL